MNIVYSVQHTFLKLFYFFRIKEITYMIRVDTVSENFRIYYEIILALLLEYFQW